MAAKTYVLLEHTKPTANVYVQPNPTQRIRMDKRIVDHAFLRITFVDKEGNTKTIRYKAGCKSIELQTQIKEFGIPANAKFTQKERDAVRFSYAVLTTTNVTLQEFLEASPQCESFWKPDKDGNKGVCDEIVQPLYKLLDKQTEIITENKQMKQRVQAANRVVNIGLKEGQGLLIRLYGSYYKPPKTIEEVQNALIAALDDGDEAVLKEVLKNKLTIDDEVLILITKAINYNIISFDHEVDYVVKFRGEQSIHIKEISSSYSGEERRRYFSEFLVSEDGKELRQDLIKDVEEADKKALGNKQT